MKTHAALAATAALLALAVTAASAADKSASNTPASNKALATNQCFWPRNADSFAAPDDRTLYVRVGMRDVYKFDIFTTCQDIDWNQRIALVSRGGGTICSGMDVEVVSRATGLGPQRCQVRNMRKLTPDEIAALPKRARP